jgi:hypothetical protein
MLFIGNLFYKTWACEFYIRPAVTHGRIQQLATVFHTDDYSKRYHVVFLMLPVSNSCTTRDNFASGHTCGIYRIYIVARWSIVKQLPWQSASLQLLVKFQVSINDVTAEIPSAFTEELVGYTHESTAVMRINNCCQHTRYCTKGLAI